MTPPLRCNGAPATPTTPPPPPPPPPPAPAPPPPPPAPIAPVAPPIPSGARACCLLIPHAPPGPLQSQGGVGIVDPAATGPHRFTGHDTFGITYTCSGGFFDFGHSRDTLDQTRWHHYHLTAGGQNRPGGTYAGIYPSGAKVTISSTIPAGEVLETAASIAYDESVFHEIETWYAMGPGGHHSSFSPEDLVSNFLGTWVARQAIPVPGPFDDAATAQMKTLLTQLGARPPADTNTAFTAITGRWIAPSAGYFAAAGNNRHLLRRSFEVDPVVPWLVPGLSFCSSTTWPSAVPKGFSAAVKGRYDVEFTVPAYASILGTTLKRSAFAPAIARIKAEAVQPAPGPNGRGYGPDFDKQ